MQDSILNIPISEAERIFPNNELEAKSVYHKLMKEWHPDHNKDPQAVAVSAHITTLYDAVLVRIQNNTWAEPNTWVLHGTDKKVRTVFLLWAMNVRILCLPHDTLKNFAVVM